MLTCWRGALLFSVFCASAPTPGWAAQRRENFPTSAWSLLFCLLGEIPVLGLRASETYSCPTAESDSRLVSVLRYWRNRGHTDESGIPCALKHHTSGNSARAILALHGCCPCSSLLHPAMKAGSRSFELKKMGTGRSQDSLASNLG